MSLKNSIFPVKPINFSSGSETILQGDRGLFALLPEAFTGIKQIGILGWGSQAPAQAQNLHDSLKAAGSGIKVAVGLREGSTSIAAAQEAGFNGSDGTLDDILTVASTSDLAILLIADGAQAERGNQIIDAMKPGATLGLSHGFLPAYFEATGQHFREDINLIMVAPKGMGPSVRMLYLQGQDTPGAGINSSIAVEKDRTGHATNYALGWSVGIGSPVTFETTMRQEVISDLTGERAILLGGLWGLVEALYKKFRWVLNAPDAFLSSAKGLTSTVSRMISELGLLGTAQAITEAGFGQSFRSGYNRAYPIFEALIQSIYNNVARGSEVLEVIQATKALKTNPMASIETSEMWRVGRGLYHHQVQLSNAVAFSAGAYIAGMMAQMIRLREMGHCTSETVNESNIEATDSLNPFMDAQGISYLVDNCSTTARLGTRKWGPQFKKALFTALSSGPEPLASPLDNFMDDPLHGDIAICFGLRPTVKIAVT